MGVSKPRGLPVGDDFGTILSLLTKNSDFHDLAYCIASTSKNCYFFGFLLKNDPVLKQPYSEIVAHR
jgi:hypothetical protein